MKTLFINLINKLIKRYYLHNNSFSNVYIRKIMDKNIQKMIDDEAYYFDDVIKYFNWNLNYAKNFPNKLILEFGVEQGSSGKVISDFFPEEIIYGFDSFNGFKEVKEDSFWNYAGFQKAFSNQKIPDINKNYKIIKGYVEDTLEKFLNTIDMSKIDTIFVHLDLDIYEPTKFVLSQLLKKNKKIIVMFDELYNYPGFENHEYRALFEEVIKKKHNYKYISFTDKGDSNYGMFIKTLIEVN